jgi:hypothetical protein
MRVLIIPEDPTLDQHILKPIVEHIFADLGRTARVEVLRDPHLRGVDESLDPQILGEIVEDNPMIDLFLVIVDRDCNRLRNEEKAREREREHAGKLLVCLAVQEVEVWMLALHRATLGMRWNDVREHCDPKERFAVPFLESNGWHHSLAGGRKRAMRELGTGWRGLLDVCPELKDFKERIDRLLTGATKSSR